MRKRMAVVMFCGPLLPSGHIETLRIAEALKLAMDERAPLVIVGDEQRRSEVLNFASMAEERGLPSFRTIMAKSIKTSAYAAALAEQLKNDNPQVTEVFLVTDDWHMQHVVAALDCALRDHNFLCTINPHPVRSAIVQDKEVLQANDDEFQSFVTRLGTQATTTPRRPVGTHTPIL